jgi:primary-amine oxidase
VHYQLWSSLRAQKPEICNGQNCRENRTRDDGHAPPSRSAEITLACDLLKTQKKLSATTRFAFVQVEEPPKKDVLAWKPGKPLMRRAATTVFDTKTGATHVGVVDLDEKKVVSWLEHKTKEYPYGQPPIIIEEFFKVGEIVKKDAGWRKAIKRRGLTDKDIELVQVDPFSSGYFDREIEKGRRLVSAVSYYRAGPKDNGYAHPIEGVVALVDLIEGKVVDLVDEKEIIPIPKTKRNYHREDLPPPRKTVMPSTSSRRTGRASKSMAGKSIGRTGRSALASQRVKA